ncbi:MAG: UDP-N-acetylmuramate:L-alanyl-gamma-D-glutamyl-meso-diaminopimelate ligase [Thiohalomonadaceae bacterium]
MHIHILGICGTFMGGIAQLARAAGHTVSGQDAGVYPPMSELLTAAGIDLTEGYAPEDIPAATGMVVIGNALSRGNGAVEHILNHNIPYTSGPQWLAEHVLREKWVLAVAGTHGKTTTASMLAWILEYAGLAPGFLIGGVPQNFAVSARAGETPFFIVEADEYDTAFFDKRSKFVHYRPRTAILNNLEYDHADIFPDLAAIEQQFHHLVRTIPGEGLIIAPAEDAALQRVLQRGCWTAVESLGSAAGWRAELRLDDGSQFVVHWQGIAQAEVHWSLIGQHNVANALAAIAAARHVGVPVGQSCAALAEFKNVRRRLELRGAAGGVKVYDDFAHHPSAIATTLAGLRQHVGEQRILAVLEPRSNTMRLGVHRETLGPSLAEADEVFVYLPDELGWQLPSLAERGQVYTEIDTLVRAVCQTAKLGDHVLVMSNGSFANIHDKLLQRLANT